MKIIFNIISILMVVMVVFLASLNTQTFLNLNISHSLVYHITLVQVMLWIFVAGMLSGIFWAASFYVQIQAKLKEYQRKLEKTSVAAESDNSKVAVLESKIAVLEKALQSALDNKE